MSGIKKVLALIIASALLLAAAPIAGATSVTDVTGTWKGTNANYTMTITFYDDETYETVIDQNGQQYRVYGTYSMDAANLYFLPSGSQLSVLNYYLADDTLTLYEPITGETMYLYRQWDKNIPEGLAGTWTGLDNGRTIFFILMGDGEVIIAYDQPDAVDSLGTYTAVDGVLDVEFTDDTYLSLQFMLTGDVLILADEQGRMLTLTRYQAPVPSAAPVPTPQQVTLPTMPLPTSAPTVPVGDFGLAGTWAGADGVGTRVLILTEEGGMTFSYEGDAASVKTGSYVAEDSTLTATYEGGTVEVFRYMLAGDTLLIMDSQLGNPLTLTRQTESVPVEPSVSPDPALLGTWGGMDGVYLEITLSQAGEIVTFVPSDPDSGGVGTYTLSQDKLMVQIDGSSEEMGYVVQGDTLTLSMGGDFRIFTKKPGPLGRLTPPEQIVAATVDAALVGTWGGKEGDVYREITISGDGTYEVFVPQDESRNAKGTCMALSGSLAVLLPSGSLQGTYTLAEGFLTLAWAGGEPMTLEQMPGPLARSVQAAN